MAGSRQVGFYFYQEEQLSDASLLGGCVSGRGCGGGAALGCFVVGQFVGLRVCALAGLLRDGDLSIFSGLPFRRLGKPSLYGDL
jgi:hypothetical protein